MTRSKQLRIFTRLLALTVAVSPSTGQSEKTTGAVIPFNTFLANVAHSHYRDYANAPATKVENEQAFEEMRHHILKLYEGKKAVSSYIEDGQCWDCIPIDPHAATPPPAPAAPPPAPPTPQLPPAPPALRTPSRGAQHQPKRHLLPAGDHVQPASQGPCRCREGTFPMMRVTLERLTQFRSLRSFFSK